MNTVDPVMIMLDKERPLVLNMSALKKAERLINSERREDGLESTSIFTLISESINDVEKKGVTAQFITILVWAGVSESDPSLSINDVGRLIQSPLTVTAKLFDAIRLYLFSASTDDAEGDDTHPLARPNGAASGRLPESTSG